MLQSHSPSYSSNRLIASQITTSIHNHSQFRSTPVALQSPYYNASLPVAPQLKAQNEDINPHLNMSIASQMPLLNLKPQLALNNLPLNKSHSINKFAANALQKSDNKGYQQYEKIDPIKPIFSPTQAITKRSSN